MHNGSYNKKTILGRAIETGVFVLNVALCNETSSTFSRNSYSYIDNGVVDSIKALIMHENFIKPYSAHSYTASDKSLLMYYLNVFIYL